MSEILSNGLPGNFDKWTDAVATIGEVTGLSDEQILTKATWLRECPNKLNVRIRRYDSLNVISISTEDERFSIHIIGDQMMNASEYDDWETKRCALINSQDPIN